MRVRDLLQRQVPLRAGALSLFMAQPPQDLSPFADPAIDVFRLM